MKGRGPARRSFCGSPSINSVNIFVFCQRITPTQQLCFDFDQSAISPRKRINFKIIEYIHYKKMTPQARKEIDKALYGSDGIIFSRWYLEPALRILENAKSKRVPVIFHVDDLLDSVPKSLGMNKYNYYSDPDMISRFRLILEMSDHVVCSTSALKDILAKRYLIRSIHQVPVHSLFSFDCYSKADLFSASRFKPYPVIGYMGSSSHIQDLDLVVDHLLDTMEKFPLLRFETCGVELPSRIREKFPSRTREVAGVNSYWEFRRHLKTLGWWLGLAPLCNSEFNSCKSDTKIVEYIQAGIPVLASSFGPYEDIPRIARCFDASDWRYKLENVLISCQYRRAIYDSCHDYCFSYKEFEKVIDFYRCLCA